MDKYNEIVHNLLGEDGNADDDSSRLEEALPVAESSESGEADAPEKSSEAKKSKSAATPYRLPIPHWLITFVGHIVAASIGLGAGYLMLHWLRPDKFPLHW